ncbi:hypothetical protein GMLC_19380 [Geomonas limicola]|uniref:Uncharacterized protein n=1 Tax=Geomonas limicola TaxID=2740186 RepID=A0A6V8NAV4_9BACT|nr:hypothetical protein [Geomonas limicola]GFO68359.1 hypothetical protein GMLC_19380 [Geomonas limicola]
MAHLFEHRKGERDATDDIGHKDQPGSGPRGVNAPTENRATFIFIIVVMAIVLVIALLRVVRGADLVQQIPTHHQEAGLTVDPLTRT